MIAFSNCSFTAEEDQGISCFGHADSSFSLKRIEPYQKQLSKPKLTSLMVRLFTAHTLCPLDSAFEEVFVLAEDVFL